MQMAVRYIQGHILTARASQTLGLLPYFGIFTCESNQPQKILVRHQRILCYITLTGKGEVGDEPTPLLY